MEDTQIARTLRAKLAERIGPGRFDAWFGAKTDFSVADGRLTVRASSVFIRDWLKKNFSDDIRACWESIEGCGLPVEFLVEELVAEEAAAVDAAAKEVSDAADFSQPRAAEVAAPAEPNPSRSAMHLACFEIGPSNEFAFRAADLTARGRQQASPVLFWGPTGVGKTHLLRGIVREYRRHHPRAAAVYLSAEQFTTGFVDAIRGGGLPSFRQKVRGAQLLAVDDLQFLAGKQRTLEELQHTMDNLLADGRQLVLGSDRSVAELHVLSAEMTSRLSGGLVCEIQSPEFSTRLEIVRGLNREMHLRFSEEVLRAVATEITAGARELRGALHRLQLVSQAHDQPMTRELADRALADLVRHSTRPVRLNDVQKVVCDVFGVDPAELRSERKGRCVSEPRMIAMWLARKYTRAAWSEIGNFFGRRSHSTVIAAHRRVEKLISAQAEIGIHEQPCSVEDAIRRLERALRTA